jgi:hypothetical protein
LAHSNVSIDAGRFKCLLAMEIWFRRHEKALEPALWHGQ